VIVTLRDVAARLERLEALRVGSLDPYPDSPGTEWLRFAERLQAEITELRLDIERHVLMTEGKL
jgi:hypothetical protein